MESILSFIQIILSVVLVVLILMQQSEAGLGSAFGGGDGGTTHRTRRGSERVVFIATIVVGVLFGLSAVISLFL